MEKSSFFRRPSDSRNTEPVEVDKTIPEQEQKSVSPERPQQRPQQRLGGGKSILKRKKSVLPQQPPENVIFGIHPLLEALGVGRPIEKIYMRKSLPGDYSPSSEAFDQIEALAGSAQVTVQWVPIEKLDRLSRRGNHQGVVATLPPIEYADLNAVLETEPRLLLVLDGITDVRNFGAIARSAECAGVNAIVVGAKSCAPINGEAMKSSAGALNRVPVCRVGSLRLALKNIQSRTIQIVAATEKGSQDVFEADFDKPTAIVMGSEERGISSEILKMSDAKVSIPLLGQIESLNVSAAAAILLFEVVRQRAKPRN